MIHGCPNCAPGMPCERCSPKGVTEWKVSPATAVDALDQWQRLHRDVGADYYGAWMKMGGILREMARGVEEDDEGRRLPATPAPTPRVETPSGHE